MVVWKVVYMHDRGWGVVCEGLKAGTLTVESLWVEERYAQERAHLVNLLGRPGYADPGAEHCHLLDRSLN